MQSPYHFTHILGPQVNAYSLLVASEDLQSCNFSIYQLVKQNFLARYIINKLHTTFVS